MKKDDKITIERVWAMPNKNTFKIKPIYDLINRYFDSPSVSKTCDPFVNLSPFADRCILTNDIDPDIPASSHIDAYDFLRGIDDEYCDLVVAHGGWHVDTIVTVGIKKYLEKRYLES